MPQNPDSPSIPDDGTLETLPLRSGLIPKEGTNPVDEPLFEGDTPDPDLHPVGPGHKLTATTVASAEQCALRAVYSTLRQDKLPPSPHAVGIMSDGIQFEATLLKKPHLTHWIKALNHALASIPSTTPATTLPETLPPTPCPDLRQTDTTDAAAYIARVHTSLQTLLQPLIENHSTPRLFHEPTLACQGDNDSLLIARPDLLLWSGTTWIVGDIKCSESAKSYHGIQVNHGLAILQAILSSSDTYEPLRSYHSHGFIVHCSPGYRYSKATSEYRKETCLSGVQVTTFPIEALRAQHQSHLRTLANVAAGDIPTYEANAVFSGICNECEFRAHCLPRFLQKSDISLFPFAKAEIQAIRQLGIQDLPTLCQALQPDHPTLHSPLTAILGESPILLHNIRRKATQVTEQRGYHTFRIPSALAKNPLFFASANGKHRFLDAKGTSVQLPGTTDVARFTSVITYTEAEYFQALSHVRLQPHPIPSDFLDLPPFILIDRLVEKLHYPIPSYTLRPLAAWCRSYSSNPANPPGFQSLNEPLQSPGIDDRCADLLTVWHFLQSHLPVTFELPDLTPTRQQD